MSLQKRGSLQKDSHSYICFSHSSARRVDAYGISVAGKILYSPILSEMPQQRHIHGNLPALSELLAHY
jgi:hypothetical protein